MMACRRLFCCTLLLALAACSAKHAPPSAPSVPLVLSGVLNGETVVSGEAVLAGDILVPRGSRLILRPGTTVRVEAAENTKIDPEYLSSSTELLVRGTLQIEGTAAAPVRFIPAAPAPDSEISWAGIELDGAEVSRIDGVQIAGAETGILCIETSPEIRDSELTGCRYGIVLQRSSPIIRGNTIRDGEGGVFCWLESNPQLLDNRISGHAEEGVFVDRSSRPRFAGNTIFGNAIGLALYPRDIPYAAAGVFDNDEDVRLLGGNGGGR